MCEDKNGNMDHPALASVCSGTRDDLMEKSAHQALVLWLEMNVRTRFQASLETSA